MLRQRHSLATILGTSVQLLAENVEYFNRLFKGAENQLSANHGKLRLHQNWATEE